MSRARWPPVSLSEWMQQVKDDPSIHCDFKSGAEGRLKVTSTAFKSGSEISATEYLHLNVIWHRYLRLDALGHLMKDDPEVFYAGYVSPENMEKTESIFNSKRHLWQNYFDELKNRTAEEKALNAVLATQLPKQHEMERKHPRIRPAMEGGDPFWWPLHFQLLAMAATSQGKPTQEEIERTSAITKPGPGSSVASVPCSVNQSLSPSSRKLHDRVTPHKEVPQNKSTPQTRSFHLGTGGKHNRSVAEECYANNALVCFLQHINVAALGSEFSSMDWLRGRIAFKLFESTDTTELTKTVDGEKPTMKTLMEARIDGYLGQRADQYESELNTEALAILDVKPFTLKAALSSTRRQEGAKMACWISEEEGGSTTGILQPSTSGRKRRLMITQHRHEIYVIVAEYGVGYEVHIRPASAIAKGPTKAPATEARNLSTSSSASKPSAQQDSSAADAPATPKRRNPKLLAGSPSYIKRVEKMSIKVSANSGLKNSEIQPTGPPPGTSEWVREEEEWVPDAGDFLIMHEFGPFLITEADHMEVLSRRVIAFMLQLGGSQDRSVPDATDSDSSEQP